MIRISTPGPLTPARARQQSVSVQVWSAGKPPGVVRSPLQPEETRGLTRSDDLSRMLPFEAHLMAAGWPKNDIDQDGNEVVKEGSRPARLLHMVRRAERNLMSYERTGMMQPNSLCADVMNGSPTQIKTKKKSKKTKPIISIIQNNNSNMNNKI